MKRFISTLLTAGLVLTSCAVNELDEQRKTAEEPIIASIGTQTKTYLGDKADGAYKALWSAGDQIVVLDANNEQATYTTIHYDCPTATFLPDEDPVISFSDGYIAAYPASSMILGSTDLSEAIYFSIPEVQTYTEDTFENNVMPMISDLSTDQNIAFNNIAGVLRLMLSSNFSGIKIQTITITAENEFISGECGYIPEYHEYFFDETMICSNEVTLDCGTKGIRLSKNPIEFNIVVPHQEYTSLSICIKTTDGREQIFNMKEDKTLVVGRSTVLNIPLVADNVAAPTYPIIEMSASDIDYDNFKVSISMKNVKSYYCGLQTKEHYDKSIEEEYFIPNLSAATLYTSPVKYNGNVLRFQSDFSEIQLVPGETYVLWIVPYNSEGIYTEEDIHKLEVETKSFVPGGTIEVTTSNPIVTEQSIEMTIEAEGSQFIYCQLMPSYLLDEFSTEEDIIQYLIDPSNIGSTIYTSSGDIFKRIELRPGTDMTFISVAIDYSGKYGPLLIEYYQTIPIEYNDLVVEIDKDIDKLKENNGVLNWTVTGGEAASYRYFYRTTESSYWTNTFEQDYTMIQEKMVLSPGMFYINNTKDNFATLSEPALEEGVEYVFVVLAVGADESCSLADHWIFTY